MTSIYVALHQINTYVVSYVTHLKILQPICIITTQGNVMATVQTLDWVMKTVQGWSKGVSRTPEN